MKSPISVRLFFLLTLQTLFIFSGNAAIKDSLRAEDYYLEGVRYYCSGELQKAEYMFEKSLDISPRHDASMYYLSLICLNDNKTNKALEYISAASDIAPDNDHYKLIAAQLYLSINEIELATKVYEDLIAANPKTSYYYELAEIYAGSGQIDKALEILGKIEKVSGESEMTGNIRYELLLMQNKYDEAEKTILALDEKFPSPRTSMIIGDLYRSKYEDSTAIRYYKKALRIDPDYSPAYWGIAEIYRSTNRFESYFENIKPFLKDMNIPPISKVRYIEEVLYQRIAAINLPKTDEMIECTLNAHPADSSVLTLAGIYFINTERPDSGLLLLKKNTLLNRASKSAHTVYMSRLYMLQKWKELEDAAKEALSALPQEVTLSEFLALAYWQTGDIAKAIQVYEQLLADIGMEHPIAINCLASLGDLYHESGNKKKTYRYYEKGLKINPDYTPILNNYAYFLSEDGKKLGKALSMSKKAIDAEPKNPTYLDTYGWLLYLTGDYVQAREYLKQATIHGGKESAVVLDHFAEVLFALKEYNLAFLYWGNADKIDPTLGISKKIAQKRKEIEKK